MPIAPSPAFNLASREDTLQAAMDMPFSPLATFADSADSGLLTDPIVGNALRDLTTPTGNEVNLSPFGAMRSAAENIGRFVTGQPAPAPMSQAAYEASPYYRKGVPWDPGMTEDRAASLATQFDQTTARNYFGSKSPVYSFLGNFLGGAVDPINYIPVFGEAAHAAAAARFGILGAIGMASSEAAVNTAALDLMTAQNRAKYGDDVSWQATINDVAFSALAGAVLTPLIHGGIKAYDTLSGLGAERAKAAVQSRAETVPNMAQARDVLNDSVTSMATTGEVRLTPASEATIRTMAADVTSNREAAVAAVAADPGQIAYHGTPHEFDAFSLDQVDTGEGAQAFGHGLYFAGNRNVAEFYKGSVPAAKLKRDFLDRLPENADFAEVIDELGSGAFTPAQERVIRALEADDWLGFDYPAQAISAAFSGKLENWDPSTELVNAVQQSGRIVSVEIPSNDRLLDWNKPISEQSPYVQQAIDKVTGLLDPAYQKNLAELRDKVTGEVFYKELGNDLTPDGAKISADAAASSALRDAGIPGHMYFDQESRKRQEGSRNYVIYDDSKVRIIDDPLHRVVDAFGDEATIRRFASNFDDGARAIFGGLNDIAPRWKAMRDAAARGDIPPELDATPEMMTALKSLAGWREAAGRDASKLSEVIKEGMGALDQADGNLSLEAKALIRAFYKTDDFVRSAGRDTITARLNSIIDEAEAIGRPQLFADAEAATKLGILRHVANDDLEANLFTADDAGTRPQQIRASRGEPAAGADRGNAAQSAENGQGGGPGEPSLIPATDFTAPRPDALPDGLKQAETRVGTSEDIHSLAEQHGVSEDGSFPELDDIAMLKDQGLLTEADQAELDAADKTMADATSWGEALKSAARCAFGA
jgi:hypothetical protein